MTRMALLKQSDLTRFAKGLRAAGVEEWQIEIQPDGKVLIVVGKAKIDQTGPNPDELLE